MQCNGNNSVTVGNTLTITIGVVQRRELRRKRRRNQASKVGRAIHPIMRWRRILPIEPIV